jgi:hypothetical protein
VEIERAQAWGVQLRAAAAFVEVVRVAGARALPVLPVKGLLTARQLYADPAQRPMVDIDLRVRPRDLEPLCDAGAAAGWTLLERSRVYDEATFEVRGQRVEIEAHIGPPGFCRLEVDAMVARATSRVEPFGVPHLQPEVHDHALVLVINVFKDKLVNASELAWTDVARIAGAPDFSFTRLAERAREGGVAAVAWIVAGWMIDVRGETRWAALRDALGPFVPRPLYRVAFVSLVRRAAPSSLPLRALARVASDFPSMQARTLSTTAAWALELLLTNRAFAVTRVNQ